MLTPPLLSTYAERSTPLKLITPHWILLLSAGVHLAVATLVGLVSFWLYRDLSSNSTFLSVPYLVIGFGAILAAHAMGTAVIRLITYYCSYLLITQDQLVTQTGLARKIRALDNDKSDIRGIDETLIGRLVGYGYPHVTGFSGTGIARFPIANTAENRHALEAANRR